MMTLYHFTDNEAATAILAVGFRDGEEGGVWLTLYVNSWGERARSALLEVRLDMSEDELKVFERAVEADEVWDDDLDDFVKVDDPEQVERFVWYEIPAEAVNARGVVRLIPREERHELMVFGVDSDD